jgi:Gamma-glutamyl cyclotransferase, AIG2-like
VDHKAYLAKFDGDLPKDTRQLRALELALDIRKFEIELYWKRTTYFWAFLALAFGAYFAVLNAKDIDDKAEPLLLISCLGFVFSVAWYLVNRASKFWQENWEKHVDLLEDAPVGPLYKTVLHNVELKKLDLLSPFSFSVSKVNQVLSFFVLVIFFMLLASTLVRYFRIPTAAVRTDMFATVLVLLTAGAVIWLWNKCTTDFAPSEIKAIQRTVKVEDSMQLIFQYGSNCLESEINSKNRLCGDARFVDIAETVEDFELAFDVQSTGRGCAAADILRKPGGKLWGVLFEVPDWLIDRKTAKERRRKSFDEIEGEGTNYKREMIKVRCPDGKIVLALTYTVKSPKAGLKTNIDYVRHIIYGLREHGVSDAYVGKVKTIAAANNPAIAAEVAKL